MKFIAALVIGLLVVGGLASPAHAARGTFYDHRGDVKKWSDQGEAYWNNGIDIHQVQVRFNERALILTSRHKNLSPANTLNAGGHSFLLDVNRRDAGPEWMLDYTGSDVDAWNAGQTHLFKVEGYGQANSTTRKMVRNCGATLKFDVWKERIVARIPVRCFPRAKRVRVYQTAAQYDWDDATFDYLMGRRKYTDWVRKG